MQTGQQHFHRIRLFPVRCTGQQKSKLRNGSRLKNRAQPFRKAPCGHTSETSKPKILLYVYWRQLKCILLAGPKSRDLIQRFFCERSTSENKLEEDLLFFLGSSSGKSFKKESCITLASQKSPKYVEDIVGDAAPASMSPVNVSTLSILLRPCTGT